MRLAFDVETNSEEMEKVDRIHCLEIQDIDTRQRYHFGTGPGLECIETGLAMLSQAALILGHNIIGYDIPVILKLYPTWTYPKVRDTLVWARLFNPEIKKADAADPTFPRMLLGKHSLEAWGHRLGNHKGSFGKLGQWEKWTPEMQAYCEQDVDVNVTLAWHLARAGISKPAVELEHRFQWLIARLERRGVTFNTPAALELVGTLKQKIENIKADLQRVFPPRVQVMKTPRYWTATHPDLPMRLEAPTKSATVAEARRRGWQRYMVLPGPAKEKLLPFNPGSRDQIAARLQERGWVPIARTATGKPKIDEDTLASAKLPEVEPLLEYLMLEKRVSQIYGGEEAWISAVKPDGRIHGRITSIGTVTGRCAHWGPNLGQVPAAKSPFGKECRALFMAQPGWSLVGADASTLEMRCLAHFLWPYDGGEFAKTVIEGSSKLGTDAHTKNARILGLDREAAKTWFYRFIYGGSNYSLGAAVGLKEDELMQMRLERAIWEDGRKYFGRVNRARGREGLPPLTVTEQMLAEHVKGTLLVERFMAGMPTYRLLQQRIAAAVDAKGYLRGLDGRELKVRKLKTALNTLLQAAGACIVKLATVMADERIQTNLKLTPGVDYEMILHVHDEMQDECKPEYAKPIGETIVQSIRDAGPVLGFRCPLDGEYKIGRTWADTH